MNERNEDEMRMRKPMTGKGDIRYWQKRVRKTSSRGSKNAFYSVQLQHAGRRMELSLGTPNQIEAAARAKERYLFLIGNGWPAFVAKYRTKEAPPAPTTLTLGQYLDAVRIQTELQPGTIEGYAKKLRQVVAEIMSIKTRKPRFDYRKCGYQEWINAVHAVPLASITPDKVREWKKRFIDSAGKDEIKRRSRTVSCNSMLRQARSLFSRRNVLDKLKIQLPTPLPFEGVNVERRTDTKFYGCGVDPQTLLRDAAAELGTNRSEEFKAFLLALVLGLRRREADLLEWESFDFRAGTLRIQPTQWYKLKTNESAAVLPVEPEILALFRGWRAKTSRQFVIESERAPKGVSYQWYRCQEVFDSLLAWLRAKGVQGQKPFHALRKLFGSTMAELHGIHVASASLRHADISTTTQFYSDRTLKLTAGFGAVLSAPEAPTPFPKPKPSASSSKSVARL
ncbi:MAG TPA: tyrosine-type recombinase/integrase [Chthoniobacterales bacterium]|nr:tyrosine-type recombinase/integrase [Chthoniobacterales bacterium]